MDTLEIVDYDVKSSQDSKKHTKKSKDNETESVGSLKDFIVDDEEEDDLVESEHEDTSSELSDSSEDSSGEESEVEEPKPKKKRVAEDPEIIKMLAEEAEAFTKGSISGTVVGGRTLRSRAPEALNQRKPKDTYYERFGRKAEQEALEKFTKKDIIEWVRKLSLEHKSDYEARSGKSWPVLSPKMSLDTVQNEYSKIKTFLDLPDSDAEDDEESLMSEEDDEELSEENDDVSESV